jgi:glycosyltransferase involved in cell wall biosynthesis
MTGHPHVSVVVCSYNGARTLGACLEAIEGQTVRPCCEVIVVDDGSTDGTAAVAARYQAVKVVRHGRNRGIAAARNSGLGAARGAIIAFTDDDCIPSASWLEGLLAAFQEPGTVVAGGSTGPATVDTWVRRYLAVNSPLAPLEMDLARSERRSYRGWLYLKAKATLPAIGGPRPVYAVTTANFAGRRRCIEELGGFDERIRFAGEEEDLCRRARARYGPAAVQFRPQAVVAHDFDGGLPDTLRRSRAYGRGSGRNFAQQRANPTVFPLPIVLLGVAAVAAIRPRWWIAVPVLPMLVCSRWPVGAIRRRRAEWLLYPYVEILQELASDIGFAEGFREALS